MSAHRLELKRTTNTIDPVIGDNFSQGYSIGSRWFNSVNNTAFTCVGDGIWKQDSNSGQIEQAEKEAPKEHFFGNLMHYPGSGGIGADSVQYIRVWLTAGLSIDRMKFFQDGGGSPSRKFTLGIYDQTTPADPSGIPNDRVSQTALTDSASGNNGSYVEVNLTSAYNVTVTGYYWLAAVATSNSLQIAVSSANRANYLPRREQAGPGSGALPATAGSLSNPTSSVAYVSAVEP